MYLILVNESTSTLYFLWRGCFLETENIFLIKKSPKVDPIYWDSRNILSRRKCHKSIFLISKTAPTTLNVLLDQKNNRFLCFFYPGCNFFCIFILSKYCIKYHDNILISMIYDICQIMREYKIQYPSANIAHPCSHWKLIVKRCLCMLRKESWSLLLTSHFCPF